MGPALRAARLRQKLSLRSVAADIGVSASLLSQVETGKTQPSVSTFYALVNRLGISVDQLFGFSLDEATKQGHRSSATAGGGKRRTRATTVAFSDAGSVVQRAGQHPTLEMEKGVIWELLTSGDRAVVDSLLVTYRPGASSSVGGRMMRHNGVEYAYLLDGVLTLKLEFDTYELHPGDSLSFDSTRPHQYVNNGDVDARGLWFVVGRQEMEASEQAAALLAQAGFGGGKG
jgi:transcriptional regulator with XRE-family HTH domain/quercetin dioxygenase-like cupin family protein